jgi:hypothetical protein
MSTQTVEQMCFDFLPCLPIVVEPTEAQISGDVGILPLRQFDDQIGFTQRFIACLNDPRDPDQIEHTFDEMVRQRLYGILAGYEDCNDHDALRRDPVFKLVGGRTPEDGDLASQPTLSRFENAIDIPSLWRLHDFFIDDFIRSFDRPPSALTLDLDAVDDPCHGQQQLALFHGFYEQYQYLPIVISCAETKQILWCAVRPGNVHAALGADDDLEYIVTRLRTVWPDVVFHVRGDAGFGMPWMYAVCERLQVSYTFGLSANSILKTEAESLLRQAVEQFEKTREPQRLFGQFLYRAGSWKNHRRVIVKAECNHIGTNLRFVVTQRPGAAVLPDAAYEEYVERGESENRNKELKCGLAGDRLSCHRFLANYFRLLLHAAALNLLVRLRAVVADPPTLLAADDPAWPELKPEERVKYVPVEDPTLPVAALAAPERRRYQNGRRCKDPLGQGHIETWRLMLIKVAGEVIQSARRILIRISGAWPYLRWFQEVCRRLNERPGSAQAQT